MFRINSIKFHNFRNIVDSEILLAEDGFKTDVDGIIIGIYGANGSSKSSVGYALTLLTKIIGGVSYAIYHNFDNDFGIYDDYMSLEYDFDYPQSNKFLGLCIKFTFKKHNSETEDEEIPYICEEVIKIKTNSGRPIVYTVARDYNFLNCLIPQNEISRIGDLFSSDASMVYALNSSAIKQQSSMFLNVEGLTNVLNNIQKKEHPINEKMSYIISFYLKFISSTCFVMPDLYGSSITNNLFAIIAGNSFDNKFLVKENEGYCKCTEKELKDLNVIIDTSNKFVSKIIKDFKVVVDKKELDTNEKGIINYRIKLYSIKKKGMFSFENESEGIKRLFLISSAIAKVMNDSDFILFIDEFDEGIFEVLFGDIIKSVSEQCMGQFMFTSHNLRPLEMMNYTHFIFSTINPQKRFVTLKGIKPKNNLRDIYIRKIMYGDENELSSLVDESDILGGLING